MKDTADLPLHLLDTLWVLGRRAAGLKGILAGLAPSDQPFASVVLDQLETALTVVEAAWSCTEAMPAEVPTDNEPAVIN